MPQYVDPSIILGIGDINNPDRIANTRLNYLKLQQAQEQIKNHNTLKALFSQAGAIDPKTGSISPNTLAQVAKSSPDEYFALAKKNADLQAAQVELQDKYMGLIDDAGLPAALAYDKAIKEHGSPQAAQAAAQTAWDSARDDLVKSGRLPSDISEKLPTKFNPDLFKAKSKQYQAFAKEQLGEEKEKFMEGLDLAKLSQGQQRINIQVGKEKEGGFTDDMGALMASLAEKGVSLPTGFRSKAQQVELYKGLLSRNPDKTPDQIADMIKTGQIEFGAQKKETTTAAAVAGKVEVAANEIQGFTPLIREASAKVPRGRFIPINKLLQMGQTQISDPNLVQLRDYVNSMLNAYDLLSARGGTDMEKRAHARSLLTEAQSPEALEAGLEAFNKEADVAHTAAVKATRVPELEQQSGTSSPKSRKVGRFTIIESP